jgi:hypothetical protein
VSALMLIGIGIDGNKGEDRDSTTRCRRRRRQEQGIDVERLEQVNADDEEGRGVVSVRPMSRVR